MVRELTPPWGRPLKLAEIAAGPVRVRLAPDAAARESVAASLGLEALPSFEAQILVRPWLDGVELDGRFTAVVAQICGVTLDPFETRLDGEIVLRAVPAGSPAAPQPEAEEALDPDAPDPPDVLDADEIDLSGYAVEHLALAIDPFPRKPGAVFEAPAQPPESSPFAALARLKKGEGEA